MKNLNLFVILLFVAFSLQLKAATNVTTATVSGHWTVSGSPYKIFNSISLAAGTSLIIDPGVDVVFQGAYQFDVAGSLLANGSAALPINFHVQDTTGWYIYSGTGGAWKGIYISGGSATTDTCTFSYCNFRDMKINGFAVDGKSLRVRYCNFYHNNGPAVTAVLTGSSYTFEMSGCEIHDNAHDYELMIIEGIENIHDNKIYNNDAPSIIRMGGGTSAIFANNEVYQNNSNECTLGAGENTIIKGNKIYNNTNVNKAAVYVNGSADIVGNLICNNHHTNGFCGLVDGGGGIQVSSNGLIPSNNITYIIRNNVIANNYSPFQGGGIRVFQSRVTIANNHIINNSSPTGGGIFFQADTFKTVVKNNLFYGNQSSSYSDNTAICGSTTSLTPFSFEGNYSNVPCATTFGHLTGMSFTGDTTTNMTGATPGMIDPTTTDSYTEMALSKNFGILSTSPCVDHGDTSGAKPYTTDYAGNPRIHGSAIDIGAYEYTPATATPKELTIENTAIGIYPNPAANLLFVSTSLVSGTVMLVDISGKSVLAKKVAASVTSFDIHSLPRGMYCATWEHDGVRDTQKVILE